MLSWKSPDGQWGASLSAAYSKLDTLQMGNNTVRWSQARFDSVNGTRCFFNTTRPVPNGPLVATTQAVPLPHVYNFGGFTDGDRAVFAADDLGAASIRIIGFDLADRNVDPVKRGKLFWAGELLHLIGYDL